MAQDKITIEITIEITTLNLFANLVGTAGQYNNGFCSTSNTPKQQRSNKYIAIQIIK